MKRFGILACILACGLVAGCNNCEKCDKDAKAAPAAMSEQKADGCCSKDKASMGAMGEGSACSKEAKGSMGAMSETKASCSKGTACCKAKAAATQN